MTKYVGPKLIVSYLYSPAGATLTLATPYRLDVADFPSPLSFSTLIRGDPLRIYVTDRQTDGRTEV